MHTHFLDAVQDIRSRTARFRRVVVHLHSIDSHDWGTGARNKELSAKERFAGDEGLETFADELEKCVDLACITDHMKCGFATRLARAVGKRAQLAVLPGMEINLRLEAPYEFARIHVLALLPIGVHTEAFGRIFASLDIPSESERTGHEELAGITLPDLVRRIHEQGGLAIAAHVDNRLGIRHRFRQAARNLLEVIAEGNEQDESANEVPESFKDYLLSAGLDAIEIHKSADGQHYRWESRLDGRVVSIATLLTSDAHNVDDFDRPDRVTHVKLTELSLNGLRQAFAYPDTRVRFPDTLSTPRVPKLLGLDIRGSDQSFFRNATLGFSDNLSCVIGVRGSGKSTVVEALRYVFGYNRSLDELDESLERSIRERQKANLTGCVIRVLYSTRHGEVRVLQATFDSKAEYVTTVSEVDGTPLPIDDLEATGEFPLRLYGWSEIELLGRDPSKQRDLLDRLTDDVASALKERSSLRRTLGASHERIKMSALQLQNHFAEHEYHLVRFTEFTADFAKVNTESVQELFRELDQVSAKLDVYSELRQRVAEAVACIDGLSPVRLRDSVASLLSRVPETVRDWWSNEAVEAIGIVRAESNVEARLREACEELRILDDRIREEAARTGEQQSSVFDEIRRKISGDANLQSIADLRKNAGRRLAEARKVRDEYFEIWRSLQGQIQEASSHAERLRECQDRIAGIRSRGAMSSESQLDEVLPDSLTVGIDFRAGQDTQAFRESLKGHFDLRSARARRIVEVLPSTTNPVAFARTVLDGDPGSLTRIADGQLEEGDAEWAIEHFGFVGRHDGADVPVLLDKGARLSALMSIQGTPWDDEERILLNGGPIDQKSPGQRSSAMLPLVALVQDAPLIIDQPEDNLDKRLIGSVLTDILARLKERRQIVVCTHDPNILVGGDAEQVVVLEAESDRSARVLAHGSIDDATIIQSVVDLLEGGEEAFRTRSVRYGLPT